MCWILIIKRWNSKKIFSKNNPFYSEFSHLFKITLCLKTRKSWNRLFFRSEIPSELLKNSVRKEKFKRHQINTIIAVFFQLFQNFADYRGIIQGPLEAVVLELFNNSGQKSRRHQEINSKHCYINKPKLLKVFTTKVCLMEPQTNPETNQIQEKARKYPPRIIR